MNKCKYITQSSDKCSAKPITGSEFCFSHNPEYKEAKLEAVKKGGLNRKLYGVYGKPVEINKPSDIQKLLANTINGVWTGEIPASQPANSIAYLARCWLDAYDASETIRRIELIEEKLEIKK